MTIENKKQYERKSIVDNKKYLISDLLWFSKQKDNQIYFDPEFKLKGRGAYCLNNISQLDILFKRKLLNKAFKQNITQEEYDKIRQEVNKWVKMKLKENQTLIK